MHTLYRLIEKGELGRITSQGSATVRSRRRRTFALTRGDVAEFIRRSRITPGTLAYLYASPDGPPESDVDQIRSFCRDAIPPEKARLVWLEASERSSYVTIWVCRPQSEGEGRTPSRRRLAQLRYDPTSQTWSLLNAFGWSEWRPSEDPRAHNADIATTLDTLEAEAVARLLA